MGRQVENIKIVFQGFGLKAPERIRGRETSFQLSEREMMNLNPGGTFFHSREGDMAVHLYVISLGEIHVLISASARKHPRPKV